MISKSTARLIHNCHSEIENSIGMIEELQKRIGEDGPIKRVI